MVNLKLYSPLSRWFYRPSLWDEMEENWPNITMTEGLDVYEEGDQVIVKAAVPGIPADQVNVTFEDGVLRITGKSDEHEEEKNKKKVVYRLDRVASFDYTTTLPRAVDANTLDAQVEDGVVIVKAKVAEAAKPKQVHVKSKQK